MIVDNELPNNLGDTILENNEELRKSQKTEASSLSSFQIEISLILAKKFSKIEIKILPWLTISPENKILHELFCPCLSLETVFRYKLSPGAFKLDIFNNFSNYQIFNKVSS